MSICIHSEVDNERWKMINEIFSPLLVPLFQRVRKKYFWIIVYDGSFKNIHTMCFFFKSVKTYDIIRLWKRQHVTIFLWLNGLLTTLLYIFRERFVIGFWWIDFMIHVGIDYCCNYTTEFSYEEVCSYRNLKGSWFSVKLTVFEIPISRQIRVPLSVSV